MENSIRVLASSLVAVGVYALHKFLFHKPSLKEYEDPYKEPVKYTLFWIRELMFRKHLKRFNVIDVHGNTAADIGVYPNELHEQLENPQIVDIPDDMDETGFMGVNLTSGEVLNVSLAKRPNNHGEAVIHFYSPSLNVYSRVIDHLEDTSANALARALALSQSSNPREDIGKLLNQYDEWGTFYGAITVDSGPETELLLFGCKTRKTGYLLNIIRNNILKLPVIPSGACSKIQNGVQNGCKDAKTAISPLVDGSSISFNAINMPNRLPEMIWGYVELGNGFRHLIQSSDFELLRFKEYDSAPKVLSIRFKAGDDHYILDIGCCSGNFDHLWGSNQDLKFSCNNVSICLTSVYHDLRLHGKGMISFASQNNLELEPNLSLPPFISEPDVNESELKLVNILRLSDDFCKSSKLVGGKGSSLAMLRQINSDFNVPDGLCITVSANYEHIKRNRSIAQQIELIENICCGKIKGNVEDECKMLYKLFEETRLSEELANELRAKLSESFGEDFEKIKFAVRSSAVGEDGEEMSAAGQMETFLGCKGMDQICISIMKCWASCFGFRAVEYRRQNGQLINVGMAVVIQNMIAADKAGVLFTRDPLDGNPAVISISANYGIGESVVSAMSEPDTIVVNRTFDNKLSLGDVTVGSKKLQVVMKEDGGIVQYGVSEEDTNVCCLNANEAEKLAEIGVLVEQSYGNPRDIEWAISENQIYLLQARPITNLHKDTDYILRNEMNIAMPSDKICATSGNIKEVLPGASSVLSMSFMQPHMNYQLIKVGKMFGINEPPDGIAVKSSFEFQRHYFGDRGRAMYRQITKSKPSKAFRNMMKGVDIAVNGRVIKDDEIAKLCLKRNRYVSRYEMYFRVLTFMKKTLYNRSALDKMKKKYQNFQISFEMCHTNEQLLTSLKNCVKPFPQALTDHVFISMASMNANMSVLMLLLGKESDVHYGDFALLLSIESDTESVVSADVPSALELLAKEIIEKSDHKKFVEMSKEEGEQFLSSEDSPVKECYRDFINRHGHRCLKEFDIYSKTWAMEPSKLVAPIQAIVRSKDRKHENKLTVDEALSRIQSKLTPKELKTLRSHVLKARYCVGNREQAKSLLIRVNDQYRQQFRKLARNMVAEGRLPDEELLFFMTMEEINNLLKTRSAKIIQSILVDASNAFNSMNRAAALHNIRITCPSISTNLINTYRHPTRLFISGGGEILSKEGTTQGDPLAMHWYSINTLMMITDLKTCIPSTCTPIKQVWLADDAASAGNLNSLQIWYESLMAIGKKHGYFVNGSKSWLIVKSDKLHGDAERIIGETVNITSKGKRHLGAVIGSKAYKKEYCDTMVHDWVNELNVLCNIATTQPQAAYTAYIKGFQSKFTYFLRTIDNFDDYISPVDKIIDENFIRTIFGIDTPVGIGLGIPVLTKEATRQHRSSLLVSKVHVESILNQDSIMRTTDMEGNTIKDLKAIDASIKNQNKKENLNAILEVLPKELFIHQAMDKGASSWLNAIPLKEQDLDLNKGEFSDALKLRYDIPLENLPSFCACGERHSGSYAPKSANTDKDARLDIKAKGFWRRGQTAFFDVRVTHVNSQTNANKDTKVVFKEHEQSKKREYLERVLEIEHASFTPLGLGTNGGMGTECQKFVSALASKLAEKQNEEYLNAEETTRPVNADGSVVLNGTPVSRGLVEATVRVVAKVEDAHLLQPGDILVTNATDISLVTIFPLPCWCYNRDWGIRAVVAREYGIPCVVSVQNAAIHLKSEKTEKLNGRLSLSSGPERADDDEQILQQ
ncbi:putative phosphoenolpyruvate synthase [Nymphon striatum]|nr:putative phosphoenolpyruvate synthase [Nymphon striatum]